MQGNRCRRSWINQRCVNHSPFLVRPEIDGCASFTFHFLNGEVQRSAGNFAHSFLLISRWSAVPIFYLRTQLGIRPHTRSAQPVGTHSGTESSAGIERTRGTPVDWLC